MMDMTYEDRYLRWCERSGMKNELVSLTEEEKKFRFSSCLEFGTAGLRGFMCAGTNAMNIFTVRQATQGFADFINKTGGSERGVVIAYDSRNNSQTFAREAACVMAANGIPVYLFESLRPTPLLSFSIRELHCIAGINITASHNPKEYNGYKAYYEDGAQLSPEAADEISGYIKKTDIFDGVKLFDYEKAVSAGFIKLVGRELDERYMACVIQQQIIPDAVIKANDLKVVYTPLHGAGYRIIPEVLSKIGLGNLYTVTEQMTPDGSFPTVKLPNPEYVSSFEPGIKLAEQVNGDIIIATDPDADRTGVMIRDKSGSFMALTGNQTGILLLDYIITALNRQRKMPPEPYAIKTIVSSELITKICKANNITLYNVLTGFKFIGEVIKKHEESGKGSFIFGFEESYGYLRGRYARDKDAVVASMLICEMAAYYKLMGMTLYDALSSVYERYGYYIENTKSVQMEGYDGREKMQAVMDRLRRNPPVEIGGKRVTSVGDYMAETITDTASGSTVPTGLPKSNVLYYKTESDDVVIVRPSGTEPKIKLYFLVHGSDEKSANAELEAYKANAEQWY